MLGFSTTSLQKGRITSGNLVLPIVASKDCRCAKRRPPGPDAYVPAFGMITEMRPCTSHFQSSCHAPSPKRLGVLYYQLTCVQCRRCHQRCYLSMPNLARARSKVASVTGARSSNRSVRVAIVTPPLNKQLWYVQIQRLLVGRPWPDADSTCTPLYSL